MTDDRALSRRALLAGVAAGTAGGLAGCSTVQDLFPEATVDDGPQSTAGPITGTVTNLDGRPVRGARVRAIGGAGEQFAETETDSSGGFSLDVTRPVWLRVTAGGYLERVVAGRPGTDVTPSLVAADGTVALGFGGDVMFGRGFNEESSDRLAPHARIQPRDSTAQYSAILRGVAPLIRSADVTSVNLESPLTTSDVRHPDKTFTFTSHPAAAPALADAGIDLVTLGNNHAFDALDVGLADTARSLSSNGIAHAGAGQSPARAWEPAILDTGDVTVAQLSCTTVAGGQYDLHWSADRPEGRPATVDTDAGQRTVPRGAGVATATPDRLERAVQSATERADVVVVQIHGGVQYQRTPTERIRRLSTAAGDAGADLVVNHHPHVTGGIERHGDTVIAWSLGNFAFDQTLWETMPSYFLTAYATSDGVVRTVVDPLLLEGFVPRGVVSKPNRAVTWQTAGHSGPTVQTTDTGLASGRGTASPTTTVLSLREGSVYARQAGYIRDVRTGSVRLGRDRLPTGTFESVDIDSDGHDGVLWRFSRNPPAAGLGFGVDGGGGVRLQRISGNSANVILMNGHRIPLAGPLTLTARYRSDASTGFTLEVAWFEDTSGSAIGREAWTLGETNGWEVLSRDIEVPDNATHIGVLFVLAPPVVGKRTVFVDDVRLIEWAEETVTGGREYDHARVETEATVETRVTGRGADWQPLDGV
jgi:poly-gamma-glutamate capsule biosynthesis protein CapA/YwtB (metallophosphatase superfamily)